MPPLENAKHERFAQELAAGKTAVDAYEAAGYRHNRGHASTLRKNPKLLKRVDEILETRGQIQGRGALAAIERARLTKTAVMDMLLADRELARQNGQASAAIRASRVRIPTGSPYESKPLMSRLPGVGALGYATQLPRNHFREPVRPLPSRGCRVV